MKKYKSSQAANKPQLNSQLEQTKSNDSAKAKQPGFAISSGLKASFSGGGY